VTRWVAGLALLWLSSAASAGEEVSPDPLDEVAILKEQAGALFGEGRYAEAAEFERQILAIRRDVLGDDHLDVATSLNNLAVMMERHGDFAAARSLYEESLSIRRSALGDEHPKVASSLGNLAILLNTQGDFEAAKPLYLESLAIKRASLGSDHPSVAGTLNGLALLLTEQGNYAAARLLFDEALAIWRAAHGEVHPSVAAGLNNLAMLVEAQGDYDAARRLHEQSLAIKLQVMGPDHPRVATSLNNVANMLKELGDYEGARPLYEQSLEIRREALGSGHPVVSTSLHNLAMVTEMQGDDAAAESLYEQSLAVSREALGPGHPRVAGTLNNLATLHQARGDYGRARAGFEQSLEILRNAVGPDHLEVAEGLANLAVVVELQGEPEAARPLRDEAMAIAESRLELLGALSEREAYAYIGTLRPILDEWLAAHDEPAAAWTHALRFKGTVGAGLRAARVMATGNPETSALAERLAATRRTLAHLALSGQASPERTEQLAALADESEALQRQLMSANARFRADRIAAAATPAELCAALPEGAALVDLLRYQRQGVPHYVAFTAVAGICVPGRIELGPAAPLDDAVASWREAMSDPAALASRIDTRGRRLTELLWTPLSSGVGEVEQLLVVPDGPLASIPLGVLPTDDGYLLERLRITYLDRANDLLLLPEGVPEGALVVGGVDYDGVEDVGKTTNRGGLAACNDGGFPPLPGTEIEADAFAGRWRQARKAVPHHLAGAEATESAVSEALRGVEVAHIATHGFFATGRCRSALHGDGYDPMLLSGLVLSGANRPPDAFAIEDGVLTAAEVASLDLTGTGVVVLSACETGLGEVKSGEGVLGLRRAFAISGTHTLVMSLWSVGDAATAELMDEFYRYHLRKRRALDPVEALRQAQLDRLAAQRRQGNVRPQEWAGFVATRSAWPAYAE